MKNLTVEDVYLMSAETLGAQSPKRLYAFFAQLHVASPTLEEFGRMSKPDRVTAIQNAIMANVGVTPLLALRAKCMELRGDNDKTLEEARRTVDEIEKLADLAETNQSNVEILQKRFEEAMQYGEKSIAMVKLTCTMLSNVARERDELRQQLAQAQRQLKRHTGGTVRKRRKKAAS